MYYVEPRREKTCLRGFANNTDADQPAHPRSLISAFVIRFLDSTILNLATGEISIFKLLLVVEETGLKLALAVTPKTGFLATGPRHIVCGGSVWAFVLLYLCVFSSFAIILTREGELVTLLYCLPGSYEPAIG